MNFTVLVGGGVGAISVICGLRSGAGTMPEGANRALGLVNDARASLFSGTVDSKRSRIEWSSIRIIKSEISGKASTIQGYLEIMATAGRNAPTARSAPMRAAFWLASTFFGGSTGFFTSSTGGGGGGGVTKNVVFALHYI